MKIHFFRVPVCGEPSVEAELNRVLASSRVRDVERRFVEDGADSFWAIAVTTVAESQDRVPAQIGSGRRAVDYKDVLSTADFAVYSRLRLLRKRLAEEAGVPPYQVMTNEQLAAFVQRRVESVEGFAAIAGVGPARTKKYAQVFLDERARPASEHEADDDTAD